jgi:nucleoside-diphosphate-sugar epimerase
MKILFIGGTGIISSACSQRVCDRGDALTIFNRGLTSRPIPSNVRLVQVDYKNRSLFKDILKNHTFDVVVNWIAYTAEDVACDIAAFQGKIGQYVFISSASAYQKPPSRLPITEETPLLNPYWEYSRQKIACEELLQRARHDSGFPMTIVRPSHTYDRRKLPLHGGYTIIQRMRLGSKIVVHGDGTSLWTLTHHRDFSKGFTGLLGLPAAIGESFHITSDELLSWNQIHEMIAHAAGVEPNIIHLPSSFIARYDSGWGDSLLGDKRYSMIFDNSKIKKFVPGFCAQIPFEQGAREIVQWLDADKSRQDVDPWFDQMLDHMINDYESIPLPNEGA